jgi:hypothetical protein
LDEHDNSKKENPRNGEPGCMNTIEYANSESSSLFFNSLNVESQLCIVNGGYAIVTKQK